MMTRNGLEFRFLSLNGRSIALHDEPCYLCFTVSAMDLALLSLLWDT